MGISKRYCQCICLWIWVWELTCLGANLNHNLFILEGLHRGSWLYFLSLCNLFETHCALQYTCLICSLQLCFEYHCLRTCSDERFADGAAGGRRGRGKRSDFCTYRFDIFPYTLHMPRKNVLGAQTGFPEGRGKTYLLLCSSLGKQMYLQFCSCHYITQPLVLLKASASVFLLFGRNVLCSPTKLFFNTILPCSSSNKAYYGT